LSLVSLFYPGPNYGIDFAGGTEVQLAFEGDTAPAEVRTALEEAGYSRPDVISVEGEPNQYIIRVREVSSLPEDQVDEIRASVESVPRHSSTVVAWQRPTQRTRWLTWSVG